MDEILRGENADLGGPLERGERLIEREADRVVVGQQARRFAGALEEVSQCVGAILESPQNAGGCGDGHPWIITEQEFNC